MEIVNEILSNDIAYLQALRFALPLPMPVVAPLPVTQVTSVTPVIPVTPDVKMAKLILYQY